MLNQYCILFYPVTSTHLPPSTQTSSSHIYYLYLTPVNYQPWIRLTPHVTLSVFERMSVCKGKKLTPFFHFRTRRDWPTQSNWTASRRAWTRSMPTCERPRKTWVAWRNAAACVCYPVTSEWIYRRGGSEIQIIVSPPLPFHRSASFKEDDGTWKGNDDGKVVNNQPQRVMDDRNGIGPQAGYIGRWVVELRPRCRVFRTKPSLFVRFHSSIG